MSLINFLRLAGPCVGWFLVSCCPCVGWFSASFCSYVGRFFSLFMHMCRMVFSLFLHVCGTVFSLFMHMCRMVFSKPLYSRVWGWVQPAAAAASILLPPLQPRPHPRSTGDCCRHCEYLWYYPIKMMLVCFPQDQKKQKKCCFLLNTVIPALFVQSLLFCIFCLVSCH